jgi:predicted dinucleotide-binding enzyme
MDTTNPIAESPPVNGVFPFFTCPAGSLMEELQQAHTEVRFVKAFNSVGAAMMVDPQLPGGPPTMFICGEDEPAKQLVGGIVRELGWEVADMGHIEAARAIEPLCMLWCIPAVSRGQWRHAFKLLRG